MAESAEVPLRIPITADENESAGGGGMELSKWLDQIEEGFAESFAGVLADVGVEAGVRVARSCVFESEAR